VDHGAVVLRNLAIRSGFGALGAVYVALGIVSARVAFLGARRHEEGIPGALRLLLEQPKGPWILGAVVASLAAIAVVHLVEAATGRRSALVRIGQAVNGLGYATLAWTAGRLLLHLKRGGGSLERTGLAWLLGEAWGATVLEVVGVAVIAGGLWELSRGVFAPLPFRRDLVPRSLARLLAGLSRFGLAARGLVLCALGYFLFRAAEELDPARVQTMGGALRAFSQTALGPVFTAVVAFGLAAYGVHMWTLMLLKRRV
jgi:Domain of Unknown Function (DUF1206)